MSKHYLTPLIALSSSLYWLSACASTPDGKHIKDQSCSDWSQNTTGVAMVGHHDRVGLGFGQSTQSWNSAHASLGCRPDQLKTTGGAGLFYCFAADAPTQR